MSRLPEYTRECLCLLAGLGYFAFVIWRYLTRNHR